MDLLGIFSVSLIVFALVAVQLIWGPDYNKTFSRLVARKKASIVFYFFIFFVFLTLFSVYIVLSFIPKLDLSNIFLITFFTGVLAQLICVSIPETGGVKTKIHLIAAAVMSVSVLAQVIIVLATARLSLVAFIVSMLSLALMLAVWLIIVLRLRLMRYELLLQSAYFTAYLATIVSAGYLT